MGIGPGTQLGPYEITSLLGKGGMGEVYRARDRKLKRDVAIKILPDEFSRDPDRVSRFQREAEVLASLNHPDIAAIYDLEEANETRFLVLELVEGETLAELMKRGPIPVEEALGIAKDICEALEAAHEKGVVHRDLKPANVKITQEGKVKVLDFGLAKAMEGSTASVTLSNSPTLTMGGTNAGVIMGTAGYMSPEQARGKAVDKRADIWAFGVVLYEMLAGRPAFSGDDVSDILAAVMRAEPLWSALPANLHPRVLELLEGCLEKNAKDRWRDIGDVRLEVQRTLTHPDGPLQQRLETNELQPKLRSLLKWVVLTFFATVILAGTIAWTLWPKTQVFLTTRLEVSLPLDLRPSEIALSPDGRRIVFLGNGRLYMRALDEMQVRAIPGTEGATDGPFFSPDGQWVAFFTGNQLKKVALDGSAAIPVASASRGLLGTWAPGGQIFFGIAGPSGLFQVPAKGGKPELVVNLEGYHDVDYPEVLPGGEWLIYSAQHNSPVSIQFDIVAQSLTTGERKVVLQGGKFARFAPTGHLVYEQLGSLYAVGFDPKKVTITGSPTPLGEHVATDISFFSTALFALAPNGTLAFVPGRDASKRHLVWVDRTGRAEPVSSLPQRAYAAPRLSPDGERVMVLIEDAGDLWIYDRRGSSIRLTRDGLSIRSAWSPDGSRVAYTSGRSATGQAVPIFIQPSDGSSESRQVNDNERSSKDIVELAVRVLDEGRVFSRDRRYVAYVSNESGREEIYITPYPGPGGKFPVSTNGGTQPVWARNGELFYRNGTRMMAVEISTAPNLRMGEPKVLFEGDYEFGPNGPRANTNYDVTPDGQRFLMVAAASPKDSNEPAFRSQINVVLNWFEELKQRVPVK